MSTDAVAVIGFLSLFGLMLLRVPVGMAMGLVGVTGFSYLVGPTPALKLVGQTSMRTVTDYTFGVIPMFLLMGSFAAGLASPLSAPAAVSPRSAVRRLRPPRPSPPSPIPRCAASVIRSRLLQA